MAVNSKSERKDARAAVEEAAPTSPVGAPVVVERLTHQDVNDICTLYKRVWDEYRPELPGELVKAWQPTPLEFTSWMEGVTYFAARRDGRMLGAVGCEISDGSCRLVHLAVDPEARRQGIAMGLVTAAVEWARHNNCHSIWADALSRFNAAAEMLRSFGFRECGEFHRHYWGEDVRLFEKIL